MSVEVRMRRGSATQTAAFTGALAEVTVNTDKKALHVHDGSTAGGNRTLMLNELGVASGVADLDSSGNVPAARLGSVSAIVSTRTALKALDTTKITAAYLRESGREGQFLWSAGDYSAQITADTAEGIYVKATAIASTAGAWVRVMANHVNVRWFGAVGDNVTDDTTAISKAISLIMTTITSIKRLYIPTGVYKVTGALTNISSSLTVYGDGPRNSIIAPVGTNGINVIGSGTRAADVRLYNFSINAVGMTGGYALTIDYTQATVLTDFSIYNPWNGIYTRQTGNCVFNNVQIDGHISGSYGWYMYGSNTARNGENDQIDVLQFNNCLVQSDYAGTTTAPPAELVVLDGRVQSIQVNGLRCLSGLRGFVTRNTPGNAFEFTPRFIVGSGLETENTYAEGFLFAAGDSIRLDGVFQARAFRADGVVIGSACGEVILDKGQVSTNYYHGINNQGAAKVVLKDIQSYNNSLAAGNTKSGIYIGGAGYTTVEGGVFGKPTWIAAYTENQKYGIDVDPAATGLVHVRGVNLSGNATGTFFESATLTIGTSLRDRVGTTPGGTSLVTATASPMTIKAGWRDQFMTVYGGSGVVVTIDGNAVANATPAAWHLPAGKSCVISYATAPTISKTLM